MLSAETLKHPSASKEVMSVVRVLQKNTFGSRFRKLVLIPGSVGTLRGEQITDSAFDRRIIQNTTRQKCHQRPGGLTGSARPFAFAAGILVGVAALAQPPSGCCTLRSQLSAF